MAQPLSCRRDTTVGAPSLRFLQGRVRSCRERSHRSEGLTKRALQFIAEELALSGIPVANLFGDKVLTSVKRSINVLEPERQRLVLQKPRA